MNESILTDITTVEMSVHFVGIFVAFGISYSLYQIFLWHMYSLWYHVVWAYCHYLYFASTDAGRMCVYCIMLQE